MRGLVAIAVGIGVVAVAAVIAAAVDSGRGLGVFAADSPEAVVQDYLEAFEAGDWERAYGHFSTDARVQLGFASFERAAEDYALYATEPRRVLHEGTDGTGERVTVRLTVEVDGGSLFGPGYEYITSVVLVREDGRWWIDSPILYLDPAPVDYPPKD